MPRLQRQQRANKISLLLYPCYPRNPRFKLFLHCHLGLDRVGDETILVGRVMQLVELVGRWLFVAGEFDLRLERHAGDRHLAFRVLIHVADRVINVFVQNEFLLTGDRQEGKHVTTGERSDERFLGINIFRVAQISGRGRGRHFVAAVEFPSVIARILLILERCIAALPGESDFMFGHIFR
jgi:hypothetical protein